MVHNFKHQERWENCNVASRDTWFGSLIIDRDLSRLEHTKTTLRGYQNGKLFTIHVLAIVPSYRSFFLCEGFVPGTTIKEMSPDLRKSPPPSPAAGRLTEDDRKIPIQESSPLCPRSGNYSGRPNASRVLRGTCSPRLSLQQKRPIIFILFSLSESLDKRYPFNISTVES